MTDRPTETADVLAALSDFPDPETGRSVAKMEQVRDVQIAPDKIELTLELTSHSSLLKLDRQAKAVQHLKEKFPAVSEVVVNLAEHHRPPQKLGQIGLTAKSVIAVGSGKGGVGKSTIAAALAIALNRAGCKTGLMDADVYGPSIPHLLGISGRPEVEDKRIVPIRKNGMAVMSMGFLVPSDEAVVWRGPMLHGAITQFLRDTNWGELDYLIIDMPPGTGDIALTLSQLLPLTGGVIVCTPQDVALLDAVKAIAMFRKVNIPVLGMVENMSGFISPDTGERYDIFGAGGAKKRAEELKVPFLGETPIEMAIRQLGDEGRLEAVFENSQVSAPLEAIARRLCEQLAAEAQQNPPQPSLPVL